MSSEDQNLTQIEIDEMLSMYEDYAKSEVERLKIQCESFKKLRQDTFQNWVNIIPQKDKIKREIATLELKMENIEKQCKAYKTSCDLYTDKIAENREKIKQYEADIAPPPKEEEPVVVTMETEEEKEKKEEEAEESPKLSELLGIEDYDPFTYTSITIKP